jgi:hypothetical protein|tara:strand:+ start:608 stop:709 length:102 start_codon:yes stop_codon:yes gene_type:complete
MIQALRILAVVAGYVRLAELLAAAPAFTQWLQD